MAIRTKIIVQQILNIDDTTTTAGKYPKYTVVLGNSISSITAGELTAAVEASAASAAAAKDSEIATKESETNAKDSENLAAIYATSSETSATQSAASAAEAERQAGLSQKSADVSAASATEAGTYKDAAELAAQNAEKSRELAEQAKTAAQQAQVAAETAKAGAETAETNAEASATTAGEHAAAAKQSELNAKTSETNAATHEVEAGNQAGNATTEADRAKAEADRAAQVVDGKLDKVDISGFIKVYKTKAEADADVANRVLGEKILVWNQTDSKYGWYKVAGTVEAPVLELVEIEQKLVSINNVHADDAGNVQITLPGGNPSLWLGEVTWFPYDKDSGVGYPGVLPADGREVLRVDYPDTWEAIEAGLIPSVSEAEWQAGATLYFSTGNGSTTFRLPDMMQGQAFRAPIKGEEDAGAIKEQIPYITTVNGIGPVDNTGAVVIGISNLEGTLPIDQGGTGATTATAAKSNLGLSGFNQTTTSISMRIGTFIFQMDNTGVWGVTQTGVSGWKPLGVAQGGTGAQDSPTARTNLALDRIIQADNETQVQSPSKNTFLTVKDGTGWGVYSNDAGVGWVALGLAQGGTGAKNISDARTNLQVDRLTQSAGSTTLYSPSKGVTLTIQENLWGVYKAGTNETIPLGIYQGGTGAKTATEAKSNLGLSCYLQTTTQAVIKSPNNFTSIIADNGGKWGVTNTGVSGWILPEGITVDSNGFLKKASPIVKVKGDGSSELNEEAVGVITERIDIGVYRISGVLGFNSDPAWGGIDGGFSIPENSNKLPLLWVDFKVEENGDIILKTYHREHKNVPSFASNFKDGIADGDPIDIPEGRWIDLRVEMPFSEEPEFPEVLPEYIEETPVVEE